MGIETFIIGQDYSGIFGEYIVHSALDLALANFKSKLAKQKSNHTTSISSQGRNDTLDIKVDLEMVKDKISNSLVQTYNYTRTIDFKDLDSPKYILDTFVEPNFFASQRRSQVTNVDPARKNMSNVFDEYSQNLIILGDLGAGKTTLVKNLCQDILSKNKAFYPKLNFPILIRLREINSFKCEVDSLIMIEFLLNSIGLVIEDLHKKEYDLTNSYLTILKNIVCDLFEELNVLILLDGFDEVNNLEVRKIILNDIEMFSTSFFKSKILVTSRIAEFDSNIANTNTFEIAPLDDNQIDIFISQYLSNGDEARKFKNQLLASPYFDTSRKPLALAHLCAIYERYHSMPERPKSVYKKIVNLYIEEWDAQRRIERKKEGSSVSEYNNLSNDRKFEFLTKFAYLLTCEFGTSTIFNKDQISACYEMICDEFQLPKKQAKLIVKEIEGHNGLILQSSNETFEFSHKSIHEFLTAEYISRMGVLPRKIDLLLSIPNELAIATALSSEPGQFFFRLFVKYLKKDARNISFLNAYLSRIVLERPDFKAEPILGFTFAYIYSILKFGDVNSIKNKSNFLHNDNLLQTDELMRDLIEGNSNIKRSFQELFDYYKVNYTYNLNDSPIQYKFVRINKIHNIPKYFSKNQPEFLIIPSFFQKGT